MINPKAIAAFLNRKTQSFDWCKLLTTEALDEALSELRPRPRFGVKLWAHQKASFLLVNELKRFMLLLDMGCVDGATEYLSPAGWVRINSYKGGPVAQYDPLTRTATFKTPKHYVKLPCTHFNEFKTARGCDQWLSDEHDMLVVSNKISERKRRNLSWKHTPICAVPEYDSKGFYGETWFYKAKPLELIGQGHLRFETTFAMDGPGINLTDAQLRVQIAVHADGYIPSNSKKVVISIKKQRKKDRLRQLLNEAGIPFTERVGSTEGFSTFRFAPPLLTKKFGPKWYQCSFAQKIIICDEAPYWDGSRGKAGAVAFHSRIKPCADFIQFCYTSTRRRCYLDTSIRENGVDYTAHAIGAGRTGNLARIRNHKRVESVDGFKYCFETDTGYLVLRRNGNIFVTGNSGKTNIILMFLKYRKQCGDKIKAIVFVPFVTSVSTWIDETAKHASELKCVPLLGTTKENLAALETEGDLFVICYQSAVAMLADKVTAKEGKKVWKVPAEKVRKHFKGFNFMVMDECHKNKSSSSLNYLMCRAISAECEWVVGLTGTPFGKDLCDLWPQFNLIDFGDTLGLTLTFYQEVFFTKKKNWFKQYEYKFKKRMLPKLKQMIKNCSIRYEIDELQDMPPLQYITKLLPPPDTSKGYCEDALNKLREAMKHHRYAEIKSNYLKLRQLSSGFMTLKGEDDERLQMEFDENPKLDALQELVEAIPLDCKAIIFHHFVYSNHLISGRLTEMKVKHARIWGGQKDPLRELKKFKDDPACRALVINSKSGSSSLNLQNANYVIFAEQPESPIDRVQAERRCWRPGQEKRVLVYDLLTRDTVDVQQFQSNRAGRDLLKDLLDGRTEI